MSLLGDELRREWARRGETSVGRAIAVGLGVAWRWAVAYALLCGATLLWAGSQYSSGQGGGLDELVRWSVVFGLITTVVAAERAAGGVRVVAPQAVLMAALAGHAVGTGVAVYWFTTKGGPVAGDWWIGPAFATVCAALWVHLLAPRVRP